MEMQRRQFIQGAAALGAGALVASLTGCATGPSTSMSDTGTDTATSGGAEIPQGFAAEDFEESAVILEPITDFVKEHTYDIVVVGAGTAGLPAVLTALEEGAPVSRRSLPPSRKAALEREPACRKVPNWASSDSCQPMPSYASIASTTSS